MDTSSASNSAAVKSDIEPPAVLPPPPPNVPADLTKVTSKYKRHAWIAMLGLFAFVGLYLFLTGWFCWTSYRLTAHALGPARNGFWPFVTGVISGVLGAFLLSALFVIKAGGDSKSREITAQEEPVLFAFLNALADRVGAPRPHRVFLSARVNAGVFYDLSFVNLLLPTKKNLDIGLGLVNSLNLSEFTAVLAHEFGHFAQRSMAVGRWVYTAQQVAGQIVVARSWLDKLIDGLSNTDIRIAWVGWLMRLIVWSIRSLLDTAFRLVILAERALVREMEFQADLVSVSATGSDALIHALHRLGAADGAWNVAIGILVRQARQGRAVPDLFALQSRIIEHTARILNESDHGSSPKVPDEHPEEHRVFEQELAEPPRMWSTHPPNRDRELNAKRVYVAAKIDSRSAFCLFRDPGALRREITAAGFSEDAKKLQTISEEEAIAAVDERFSSSLFHERYRGIYLGRPIGLAAQTAQALVGPAVDPAMIRERLAELYPESLATEYRDLRVRSEERAALEALRDGILDAPGGIIRHRGQTIPRRKLAGLIEEVNAELQTARTRIEDHDRACRAVHLAAARALGQGWEAYLVGLIKLHHYAAHAEANLDDARGYLANVFAIVTADGSVSSSERRRLIMASVEVHAALAEINGHRKEVILPNEVLDRLWTEMGADEKEKRPKSFKEFFANDFDMPLADDENIGKWLQVIDSWINEPLHILGPLERVSLQMLVEAENHVGSCYENGTDPGPAPTPAAVPARYQTLTRDQRRERQKKLDLWDRFQIADGFFPTLGRLIVAGGILAVVMGAAQNANHEDDDRYRRVKSSPQIDSASLTVLNGLDTPIVVEIAGQTLHLTAHDRASRSVSGSPSFRLRSRLETGQEIESFNVLVEPSRDYVYSVAHGAILLQNAESPITQKFIGARNLGARIWYAANEDPTFAVWRAKQETIGRISPRFRVTMVTELSPVSAFGTIDDETERKQMILAHVQWDVPSSRWIRHWLDLARSWPDIDELLSQRTKQYPHDVLTWQLRMTRSSGAALKTLCDSIHLQSARSPEDADWHYLALRCDHNPRNEAQLFLDEYKKNQYHPYIAETAAQIFLRQKKYPEAIEALDVAASAVALVEENAPLMARLLRLTGSKDIDKQMLRLSEQSNTLAELWHLETGMGVSGGSLAYHELAQGKLEDAVKMARSDKEVAHDILALAAASDGASRTIVDEYSKMPAVSQISNSAWVEVALLDREGRPHTELDAALRRWYGERAAEMIPFGTSNFLNKGRATVDAAFAKFDLDKQAIACTMVLVRSPERAPAGCRPLVKAFLFASEKPFFK